MSIIDTLHGYQVEPGDFIVIDGEEMEILSTDETDDNDEISVKAYSHTTGLTDTYPLFADDTYEVWGD